MHCLKQTELKYGEALVHSDGLSKHGILLMWKITEMRKTCLFFFSQNFCITLFINSSLQNIMIYSDPDFVMCLVVTVLDLSSLPPKSKSIKICKLVLLILCCWLAYISVTLCWWCLSKWWIFFLNGAFVCNNWSALSCNHVCVMFYF